MISSMNLIACMLMGICGIVLPIILVVVWKRKTNQPMKTVLAGAATFFVFAIIFITCSICITWNAICTVSAPRNV